MKHLKILLVSISLVLFLGLTFDSGFGIEFKKYKVINSPKVCGDKLCSEIDEIRSKQGKSIHDVKICGDKPCTEISSLDKKSKVSPLGQFKLGVPIHMIQCKSNQVLAIRADGISPVCLNQETREKLINLNWVLNSEQQEKVIADSMEKIPETQTFQDVGLSVIPEMVDGTAFLVFEGYGWHRLHNVEITLSSIDGESISVRSKTSDAGDLFMPWPIPESITTGTYTVLASDGIHDFEMEIPITNP